ncbi:LOW QUALITY PROTEIN: uncharacterized protein EMH_0069640 [Eimeria mitis]|uniref:Uncharacterized protein n=1 Tax=Eimeria mitis TaxID=44415 RepID=U6K474_9EIME|nr:LOW QUALITY PROTEIN: uncharacterized protein EMH_0069640 [Eimeria mitis]CDJ31781.1 hypothetical protein, conserved [Eimeria mitis]
MGDQLRNAGPPLLEELNPHHGDVDAAQPGPDNARDEVAKGGGVFSSLKSGQKVAPAKPLLAAFLLLLVSGVLFRASSRWSTQRLCSHKLNCRESNSQEDWTPLYLDDGSIQKYLDDFNKAAEEMKDAWQSSKPPVRRAFQIHFTPSLNDAQVPSEDPLATINDHVSRMRECKIPSDSSVEARKDFAQHLHLLRSLCRAVTLRLEELKWLAHVSQEFGLPISFPGYDQPSRHPGLEDASDSFGFGMRAVDFLGSLELVGGERTQAVDGTVAKELIYHLLVDNKHNLYNLVARCYFEPFLQPFGGNDAFHTYRSTASYQIPYTGKSFQTGALAHAAARIFRESDSTTNYANVRKLHRIADNWTPKRVLKAMRQQEKENAYNFQRQLNNKREQMRVLLREGMPNDDLVINALFLL